MSSSILDACAPRRQDNESLAMPAIIAHADIGDLVLGQHLSPVELAALAEAQPALHPKIKALEERWFRACIQLCGGSLEWTKPAKYEAACADADGWMAAWRALEALRTEYLTVTLPTLMLACLPETLPWGDETWTRLHDLPKERSMRDAFGRCALFYPSIIDGCNDPQCDAYPVGVAFYKRVALYKPPTQGLGDEEEYVDRIYQLRQAFYPDPHSAHDEETAVMAPMSVAAVLANLPSPIAQLEQLSVGWRGVPQGVPLRRLDIAIFAAVASCAPFVALCVGASPALTPLQALEVLSGTKTRVRERLSWADSNSYFKAGRDGIKLGDKGVYDDDDECDGADGEAITSIGIDQVEKELKASLAAVAAKYALSHAGLTSLADGTAPLGLKWDASIEEERRKAGAEGKGVLLNAAASALAAHTAELSELMSTQLRTLHGDGPMEEPTVYPVMLTDSDDVCSYWSAARSGGNDHEGVQAFAFVSEAWVLVVASKSPSC